MNTRMTVVSKEHILGKEVPILGTLDEPLEIAAFSFIYNMLT